MYAQYQVRHNLYMPWIFTLVNKKFYICYHEGRTYMRTYGHTYE